MSWPEWTSPDGRIRLINADCLEVRDRLPAVDCFVTDPPYGISLENHARGKERRDMDWTIAGDDTQEIGQNMLDWIAEHSAPCISFASPMRPWAGTWRQYLVWEKGEHVSGGGDPWKCWKPSWELIQVARTPDLNGRRDGAVLRFQAVKDDYANHPSPKPVELLTYLIGKASRERDVICDPFGGCAPTAIACIRTDRRCICIEKERKYWEIGIERCQREYNRTALFNAQEAVA